MVSFFEDLCEIAVAEGVSLQICFSSRHFPSILIQKGVEVVLQAQEGQANDIQYYIKSKPRVGKSKAAQDLMSDVFDKSSRIFLWVAVSISKMRERLNDIPRELGDLFELILSRYDDNPEQLKICVQWILFVTRPLKPQELYFAVQFGLGHESAGYWDSDDVDLDQLKTFVRCASKGLAEITRNKAQVVQFIHESVREFLNGRYNNQRSLTTGNFEGYSHQVLRDCCMAQLNVSANDLTALDESKDRNIVVAVAGKDFDRQGNHGIQDLPSRLGVAFPFLQYSVENALCHANSCQRNGINQASFLVSFPVQQFLRYSNLFARYRVRMYKTPPSLLYILAERNLADLIHALPGRGSCFTLEPQRYGPPLFAALASGATEAANTLFNLESATQPSTSSGDHQGEKRFTTKKISMNLRSSFTFTPSRSPLSYAADHGDEAMLAVLLAQEVVLGHSDGASDSRLFLASPKHRNGAFYDGKKEEHTPLHRAARFDHAGAVRFLLEALSKTDVEFYNSSRDLSPPYCVAARYGHGDVVKVFLDSPVLDRDTVYQRALNCVRGTEHAHIVRLLLERGGGVGPDRQFKENSETLRIAARFCHEKTVKHLLGTCMVDANEPDGYGTTAILHACFGGHESIVRLLLNTRGVNMRKEDQSGLTCLSIAAHQGHTSIVRLLLDSGKVDADEPNVNGRTPLSFAAAGGFINAWGVPRIYSDSIEVMKLLLDTGKVDVNRKDATGRTPLGWAAIQGNRQVAVLLLEKGADVHQKDNDGLTPARLAARHGPEEMTEYLEAYEKAV